MQQFCLFQVSSSQFQNALQYSKYFDSRSAQASSEAQKRRPTRKKVLICRSDRRTRSSSKRPPRIRCLFPIVLIVPNRSLRFTIINSNSTGSPLPNGLGRSQCDPHRPGTGESMLKKIFVVKKMRNFRFYHKNNCFRWAALKRPFSTAYALWDSSLDI